MTALEDVVTTLEVDDIVDGADVLAEVEGDDGLAVVGLEVLATLVVAESCDADCCVEGVTAEVGGTVEDRVTREVPVNIDEAIKVCVVGREKNK